MKKTLSIAMLLVFAFSVLLSACAPSGPAEPKPNGDTVLPIIPPCAPESLDLPGGIQMGAKYMLWQTGAENGTTAGLTWINLPATLPDNTTPGQYALKMNDNGDTTISLFCKSNGTHYHAVHKK